MLTPENEDETSLPLPHLKYFCITDFDLTMAFFGLLVTLRRRHSTGMVDHESGLETLLKYGPEDLRLSIRRSFTSFMIGGTILGRHPLQGQHMNIDELEELATTLERHKGALRRTYGYVSLLLLYYISL